MLDSAQKAKEKWYKYFMNTYAQTPIVIDSGQGSKLTHTSNLFFSQVMIDELESPGFYEEVEAKVKYIKDYIKNLNSDKVVEVRGKGLMIGIELN